MRPATRRLPACRAKLSGRYACSAPGTADAANFTAYRAAGVNRLSLGVQSLSADRLRDLGRIHGPDEARRAFREEGLGLGESRIDAQGDPRLVGLAAISYGGAEGRLVLLTASAQAESPLEVLAGLARTGLDLQGVQPVLKRLIADYGLDFFYVCVERGGTDAEPQVLAALGLRITN